MNETAEEQVLELSKAVEALLLENATLTKLLTESGLGGATEEVKRLNREVAGLRERVAGLQNEKNAAIAAAKSARSKAKKEAK